MSILADRLQAIKPSPTVAVTAKANQLKADGVDVIGLGAGEPDFDTPAHITVAAKQALDEGKTRYGPPAGIPALRQAIVDKFARENDLAYTPDQITVAAGGKQIIFNAFLATLNPGDEVITPAPYWVSYPDIALLFGGKPVIVDCTLADDFKLQPDALARAITPKTKWLILNSPNNPTGASLTGPELKALADVLMKPENSHVYVLSDDIYEHVIYDGFQFNTLAQVEPGLKDRVLTLNGVSKAYAMTGWRLGYAGGPAPLIKAINMINSQSLTSPTTFVQWATIAALDGDQSFIDKHNDLFKTRRDLVVNGLNAINGLQVNCPAGAFYVYPSCAGVIGRKTPSGQTINDDSDFVTYLLEAEGLACVQGAAFGLSPHFRISYATSTDLLEEAMHRLKRAVDALG